MKGTHLGEFEELVLLTVGVLYDNAYSVAICKEVKKQTGRRVNISAIHSAVYRLEAKGYLDSRLGEATGERGGKRKRLFTISLAGKKALDRSFSLREKLKAQIPTIAYENLGKK